MHIIELKGLAGRFDDMDIVFREFIGPGTVSQLFGWLRSNGFKDISTTWVKEGRLHVNTMLGDIFCRRIEATVMHLLTTNEISIKDC